MLLKKKRVNKELFDQILKEGRALPGSFFVFRYTRGESPHFSFVVPKKIEKRAVARNRLKRIGYNCLRKQVFPLPNINGIFFYKKVDTKKPGFSSEIEKDIKLILSKI